MKKKRMVTSPVLILGTLLCTFTTAVGQLPREFVVAAGESILPGDVVILRNDEVKAGSPEPLLSPEYIFNADGTSEISIARLSAERFVVAYQDGGNNAYGTVVVADVVGGAVAFGREAVFNTGSTHEISVLGLTATKFVLVYRDGATDHGVAIGGDIVGDSIALGWRSFFNEAGTHDISASVLSEAAFVVAYRDAGNSDCGTVTVGEVSGSSIAFNGEYVFNSAATSELSVAGLTPTTFVVAYEDVASGESGTAVVGNVSDTGIAFGAKSVFNSNRTWGFSAVGLSPTRLLITYRWERAPDGSSVGAPLGSSYASTSGALCEVLGSLIDYSEVSCPSTSGLSALSERQLVFAYPEPGVPLAPETGGDGIMKVGTLWRDSIIYSPQYVFKSSRTRYVGSTGLSGTTFAIAYHDAANAGAGTVVLSEIGGVVLGVAAAGASGGETVPIVCQGVSDLHSGLVPGLLYYVQRDGDLTPLPTGVRVGLAISPTELLLDIER